jgi:uncharacterized C2H2 Zn-finger protein
VCNAVVKSIYSARFHVKTIHYSGGRVQCNLCGKMSKNEKSFASHLRVLHSLAGGLNPIKSYGTIIDHTLKEAEVMCTMCGKTEKNEKAFVQHIRLVHHLSGNVVENWGKIVGQQDQ